MTVLVFIDALVSQLGVGCRHVCLGCPWRVASTGSHSVCSDTSPTQTQSRTIDAQVTSDFVHPSVAQTFTNAPTSTSSTSSSSVTVSNGPRSSSSLQSADYQLYVPPSAQEIEDGSAIDYKSITYKSDGDVPSGQYKGYHIVVALKIQEIPDYSTSTVEYYDYDFFITRDYKTFLVATDFYNGYSDYVCRTSIPRKLLETRAAYLWISPNQYLWDILF